MGYLFLALVLAAAAPQAARAQSRNAWESGRNQSAEEHKKNAAELEEAVKTDPNNIELYIRLGFVYSKLEKVGDAQRAFENAVRLDPKRAIAHYMLGLIYEKKGLRDNAIAAWKACLENASEPRLRETALKHLHHLRAEK
jgi:cytochrome c-type biogenesis protein CcmH/NrfG